MMSTKSVFSAFTGLGAQTVVLAVVLATMIAPASAGTKDDVRSLQERMIRVEQGISAQSAATVRISELERANQELTGRIEQLSYQLEQSNRRLDAISAALAGDALAGGDLPAGALLSDPGISQGPVDLTTGDPIANELKRAEAADAASAVGPAIELPLNPDAAFDYASSFLLKGDYQRAKSAFALYVEAFPNHPRTADAQFRLGEIHLALGENAAAADVFIGHIRTYPSDPRAAEAYLKLGTSFARLEKADEACTVFRTMRSKYPNAADAVRQRRDLEMTRINCK